MSTITWLLVSLGALSAIMLTVASVYSMLRYGTASARITEMTTQLAELRGYLDDARDRVKDLEERDRTQTALLSAANDKISVLQDLASGRVEILAMGTSMQGFFNELREGQRTILTAIEAGHGA